MKENQFRYFLSNHLYKSMTFREYEEYIEFKENHREIYKKLYQLEKEIENLKKELRK